MFGHVSIHTKKNKKPLEHIDFKCEFNIMYCLSLEYFRTIWNLFAFILVKKDVIKFFRFFMNIKKDDSFNVVGSIAKEFGPKNIILFMHKC